MLNLFLSLIGIFALIGIVARLLHRYFIYIPDRTRVAPKETGLSGVEEIVFKAADGTKLIAWYLPARDRSATLLYFTGNSGNTACRAGKIATIGSDGYGVFMLNYRRYGGSEGRPTEASIAADAPASHRGSAPAVAAKCSALPASRASTSPVSSARGGTHRSTTSASRSRLAWRMASTSSGGAWVTSAARWPCSHRLRCVRAASALLASALVTWASGQKSGALPARASSIPSTRSSTMCPLASRAWRMARQGNAIPLPISWQGKPSARSPSGGRGS